jgi:hypothetical protein
MTVAVVVMRVVVMLVVVGMHVVLLRSSTAFLARSVQCSAYLLVVHMSMRMPVIVPVATMAVSMMVMPACRPHPKQVDPEADTGNEQ